MELLPDWVEAMEILEESNGFTLYVDGGQFYVQGPIGKGIPFVDEAAARFNYAVAVALAADPPPKRDGSLHPGQGVG